MLKVMAFGVFDGLHDGHRHFLNEARSEGDHLTVVVTPDHIVYDLKGKAPDLSFEDRSEVLRGEGLADMVIEGDAELGTWDVLRRHRPDIVVLGYDQQELATELESFAHGLGIIMDIRYATAHEPETQHSSRLRGSNRG